MRQAPNKARPRRSSSRAFLRPLARARGVPRGSALGPSTGSTEGLCPRPEHGEYRGALPSARARGAPRGSALGPSTGSTEGLCPRPEHGEHRGALPSARARGVPRSSALGPSTGSTEGLCPRPEHGEHRGARPSALTRGALRGRSPLFIFIHAQRRLILNSKIQSTVRINSNNRQLKFSNLTYQLQLTVGFRSANCCFPTLGEYAKP